jgi:hypothetical protein
MSRSRIRSADTLNGGATTALLARPALIDSAETRFDEAESLDRRTHRRHPAMSADISTSEQGPKIRPRAEACPSAKEDAIFQALSLSVLFRGLGANLLF